MSLSSKQISMLKDVIKAAKEGRYCHGNGAIWVYVSESDRSRVISADHVREEISYMDKEASERYLRNTPAHMDNNTATSLENFIKNN